MFDRCCQIDIEPWLAMSNNVTNGKNTNAEIATEDFFHEPSAEKRCCAALIKMICYE